MGLDALLATMEQRDTPDTLCNPDGVSAKPAPIQACTPDTCDTSCFINAAISANIASGDTPDTPAISAEVSAKPAPIQACTPDTCDTPAKTITASEITQPAKALQKGVAAPLNANTETAIRAWLAHINETDQEIIDEVLDKCRADGEARAYFLRRAEEVPPPRVRKPCAEGDGNDTRFNRSKNGTEV
jgi:hypothetical protein